MNASTPKNKMQLVAAIERGEGDQKKSFWTRIGVAFENRDGSWNLLFDYLPAHLSETTIQLRNFDPKEEHPDEAKARPETAPAPNASSSRARR